MDNKKIVSAISFILVGLILLSFSLFGIIKSSAETPYYRIRFDYESGHAPDIDDVAYYFVLFCEQLTETSIENEENYEIEFFYYFDDYSFDEWQSPIVYISTSSLEVWKDTIGDGDNHEFEEYLVDVDWYLIYEFSSRLSYERVSLPSSVGSFLSITKYTNESEVLTTSSPDTTSSPVITSAPLGSYSISISLNNVNNIDVSYDYLPNSITLKFLDLSNNLLYSVNLNDIYTSFNPYVQFPSLTSYSDIKIQVIGHYSKIVNGVTINYDILSNYLDFHNYSIPSSNYSSIAPYIQSSLTISKAEIFVYLLTSSATIFGGSLLLAYIFRKV